MTAAVQGTEKGYQTLGSEQMMSSEGGQGFKEERMAQEHRLFWSSKDLSLYLNSAVCLLSDLGQFR